MPTRLLSCLAAAALAGLLAHTALAQAPAASSPAPQSPLAQPMSPEQFSACVQGLADQTSTSGRPLSRADFLRIAGTGKYDDRVRQSMLVAAGEPTFWWDELAATTDEDRVRQGREILARDAQTLQKIQSQFGVPKEIVLGIYGIETNFGPAQGKIPVLDAALSYACLRPCPATATGAGSCIARERAYAAVRVLRDGRVRPENWQGSWAAAFGRTQFVPDSFEQLAVDFDGDGVADIVNSDADAWATTANHLKQRGGWDMNVPVYIEVTIPPDQQAEFAASGKSIRLPDRAKPLSQWVAQGWRPVGTAPGQPAVLPVNGDPQMYPFLPVGLPGPAFLVSHNFDTILRYNRSDRYVMEVALLAHKIAGGGDFVTPWPTDDPGLTRAQVRELQAWLLERGHTQVTPDGVMGRNTRDAIEQEFVARGLPPQRRVGQRTMRLLMQPASQPS
jgi:membrane-bound lytic murein transglycosylase B